MSPLCPRPRLRVKSLLAWRSALQRWLLLPLAGLLSAALVLGCGESEKQQGDTPKEIYDVPPAIEVPIADDPQEAPRPKGLSGRLPSGFPEGLPLYLPASLIDYGLDAEERWVDILAPAARASVESQMLRAAAEAGWSIDGSSLRRGERAVRLEFRDGNPGTIVRVFF